MQAKNSGRLSKYKKISQRAKIRPIWSPCPDIYFSFEQNCPTLLARFIPNKNNIGNDGIVLHSIA
jgi:hypothetical protein